ncbi:hypothetical protein GDO78_017863 [Eleutherodactylus coqui]|uniref:Uncharacterized protein n=1 Tax=Eleutherodactylus coqui TaxID=57060 RepID=A0A8J6B4A3_ELECQ|nr:hypothetical protein GDO78_017863 [Eleutherodactylus coqui]
MGQCLKRMFLIFPLAGPNVEMKGILDCLGAWVLSIRRSLLLTFLILSRADFSNVAGYPLCINLVHISSSRISILESFVMRRTRKSCDHGRELSICLGWLLL